MAQQHLDRLTAVDAGFLHQESAAAHMHVGGLLLFQGSAPEITQVLDHVRKRLHLVPRCRQKLALGPGTGRPRWIDDTDFQLERHLRQATLPQPRTETQLLELAARILSEPLDRAHPLWELWLVDGILPAPESSPPRFALISKTHHAMADGIAGVDLATVLLDLTPDPAPVDASALLPWRPRPRPGPLEFTRVGGRDLLRAAARTTSHALRAAARPHTNVRRLGGVATGLESIARAALDPAPRTPLNVEIGPNRRLAVVRQRLDDYMRVKEAFGSTLNDVVLSVMAGALREWLHAREQPTDGVTLRALVPVSTRASDERRDLGNRLSIMRGSLPVGMADPVARLRTVSAAMDGARRAQQTAAVSVLAAAGDLLLPTVLAQASRLQFSTWLFNLLVTNVPGPRVPLYLLGRQLEDLFPIAFLPRGHALAVAIMSYGERLEYGLLGDFDALPDIGLIGTAIDASLAELVAAADRTYVGGDPAISGD